MKNRYPLALAAVLVAAPPAARAQSGAPQILATYTLSGCVDGITNVNPFVQGRVACFGGMAQLERTLASDGSFNLLRITGLMTASFDPGFTGTSIAVESFGASRFDVPYSTAGGACAVGCVRELYFLPPTGFTVANPQPSAFRTFAEPVPLDATWGDLSVLPGRLWFAGRLPGDTQGGMYNWTGAATLTATPEPSTFVLAAAGLAAAGLARRRGRVRQSGRPA